MRVIVKAITKLQIKRRPVVGGQHTRKVVGDRNVSSIETEKQNILR